MEPNEIIEQYKLYVEMADRVSDRRAKANQFYMALLSGLLVVVSFVVNKDNQSAFVDYQEIIFLAIGILGLLICFIWNINIRSYRQLNTAKFKVIHELEEKLAYAGYTREWEFLGKGAEAKKYLQLTRVEAWVPIILTMYPT